VREPGGLRLGQRRVVAGFHDGEVVMIPEREECHSDRMRDARGYRHPQYAGIERFGAS
jgi:hypothetical protein